MAHNAANRRLRFLRCGVEVVLHLRKRQVRVHHAEIAHRVYFDGDVIARDDVLRGHVKSFDAQRDAIESLDRPENQAQPGRLGVGQHASETQNDSTLPLLDDVERVPEPDQEDDYGNERPREAEVHQRLLPQAAKIQVRCFSTPRAIISACARFRRHDVHRQSRDPHHSHLRARRNGYRGHRPPELSAQAHHALK